MIMPRRRIGRGKEKGDRKRGQKKGTEKGDRKRGQKKGTGAYSAEYAPVPFFSRPATQNLIGLTDQVNRRRFDSSLHPVSSLLNPILMEDQARRGTRFLQFEFQCSVDAMVGPSSGRIGKDLLGGLIGKTHHQVPIAIVNGENQARRQFVPALQPAAKFRINGGCARPMVWRFPWFRR
jgi:hypothetical protein